MTSSWGYLQLPWRREPGGACQYWSSLLLHQSENLQEVQQNLEINQSKNIQQLYPTDFIKYDFITDSWGFFTNMD